MFLSKSFGYALRGVLCVAMMSGKRNERIQLDEMADLLKVPRYFLGKIMNRLVKNGVLSSVKGHNGGFGITELTRQTSLWEIAQITGEVKAFDVCELRFRFCSDQCPCPLHHKIDPIKREWKRMLDNTTVDQLLCNNMPDAVRNIAAM